MFKCHLLGKPVRTKLLFVDDVYKCICLMMIHLLAELNLIQCQGFTSL